MHQKFCQNCGHSRAVFEDTGSMKSCGRCGATDWAMVPKKHAVYRYALSEEDRVFLRVQGIDPEED